MVARRGQYEGIANTNTKCEGSRGRGGMALDGHCKNHGIPINLKLRRGERERMPAACQAQEIWGGSGDRHPEVTWVIPGGQLGGALPDS